MGIQPIIVLGMHRSGTSCLTGSLEQAGVFLGRVNKQSPHNAKGNRENRDIWQLNEAVLAASGASWDRPPNHAVTWSEDQVAGNPRIAEYPMDSVWAFKDPRTLFTLDGWLEALPDARMVGSFRNPAAVAWSLHDRDGFSIDKGIDLWLRYNRRLLEVRETREVPMVCFDAAPERYTTALTTLSRLLDLTPPDDGFDFFEEDLRRAISDGEAGTSAEAQDLYETLLEIAV